MPIGARIKARREALGYSVDDVAKKLGKNRATIYRYESDFIENMPVSVLEPIAQILETTPAALMGWDREPDELDKKVLGLYPDFVPGKATLPVQDKADEIVSDDNDIRYIARKMQNANPEQKEMLMRMIKAAFADDDDE